jgi:hypothetical protein
MRFYPGPMPEGMSVVRLEEGMLISISKGQPSS